MSPFKLLSLFLLAAAGSVAYATTTCNVLDYGGVANGATDVAPAIMKTYADCVARATTHDPADAVLFVPKGNYALQTAVKFDNTNYFTIEIDGTLNLVFNPSLAGNMFSFTGCNYVVWKGTGTINGNGNLWRPNNRQVQFINLSAYPSRPRLVRFENCNNIDISGVTLVNSPMFHVVAIGNNNVVHDMKIVADHIGETDGIDITGNNNYVHDVSIENGDECVTLKSPVDGFVAENIQCLYSGGCNIGSFGEDATDVSVQNVYYRNVAQYRGDGGIVLKSYPSVSGVVRNVTYVDFKFIDVAYPIKIDSYWCGNKPCPETKGSLSWQDITFQSISGTGDSSSRPTVTLSCIPERGCTDIKFEDVYITKESNANVASWISNACGSGMQDLAAC